MMKAFVLFVLFLSTSTFCAVVRQQKANCGYELCPVPDPNKLNVHLVPHSHDDVGWLKTVDQYYYGSNGGNGVQYILDEIVQSLLWNPERRFSYAETSFFWRWWEELDATQQDQVKELVNAGRLEFIGGGWSQSDEATPYYQQTIDQMTFGLRKLNETFGECGRPRVAWQIDPFGHSREVASQFAQMGFDGLFFARIDKQDRDHRRQMKTLEHVWEASRNLGEEASLFTGAFYTHYSPPSGFCFDLNCGGDTPIIDNNGPDDNVESRVEDFVKVCQEVAQAFVTNNIMFTMGDDFNYQSGSFWYRNMDKIIKHVNELRDDINVFYSTPSCYLKALNNANITWSTKQDDFFPYSDREGGYWTGFYASRPTSKHFIYKGNHFLQVTKQLHALAALDPQETNDIFLLKDALGIAMHHDAITGTEVQYVADDYARMLNEGFTSAQQVAEEALNKLLGATDLSLESCLLLNISQCNITEQNQQFVVTVYNPLGKSVSHYIRIPVTGSSYQVTAPDGSVLISELIPIPEFVQDIPGRMSFATNELVFRAEELPPLGYHSYYVSQTADKNNVVKPKQLSRATFGNEAVTVTLNDGTNLLESITRYGEEVAVSQNFLYYVASHEGPNSNAYIFTPVSDQPTEITSAASGSLYEGLLVKEAVLEYTSWIKQIVRVYEGEDHVELDWLIGPIPRDDELGKEVITRFETDLRTNGVFYTDTNGREMEQRQRNYRPSWEVEVTQNVSGNYYPVTSRIVIREDGGQELAVLNDRPQGGSSIKDGQIELMLHRRIVYDPFGSTLDETAYGEGLVVRGKHYMIVGSSADASSPSLSAQEKFLAQSKSLQPWTFFTPTDLTFDDWSQKYATEFAGMTTSLPDNVHLLTLEPWSEGRLLLRLEHLLEADDDTELSQPVIVNIQALFTQFTVTSATETTLSANQFLSEKNRLVWHTTSEHEEPKPKKKKAMDDSLQITLQPMQIRTFILDIEWAA